VLLGYQNPPGNENLERLFNAWKANAIALPLVLFRYSLEQGSEGDRMYFARIAYDQNGLCPATKFGQAFNSTRGFPLKASNYKLYRPRFHKANDQAIPSYAAVLWWTKYARYYLSAEQKSEMAEHGHLSTPFTIPLNRIDEVPALSDVEVPLAATDVRHALEFLEEAGLVKFKKQARAFEVLLKEDRYIRLPQSVTAPRSGLDWKSPVTSYPPGGTEVFEREEAEGDGRPAGGRAGRRAADRIVATWLLPPAISIWCMR